MNGQRSAAETLLFIVVDIIIYALLVYVFGIEWMIAFVASTVITFAIWYIYYFITYWEKK